MYHPSLPFPVYCRECWYGDGWDPTSFGREYDFSKNFFKQYKELQDIIPRPNLWQRNAINSDYSNVVAESKNVYLSASVVMNSENVFYSRSVDKSTDIVDCTNLKEGQNLYENVECEKNFNSEYLLFSRNCLNSYFLVDCVNCSNCTLSSNLRNKEFYIRNQKYSKEEYFKEVEKLNFKSRNSREKIIKEFEEVKKKAIYRFANIVRSVNSTGNNLSGVKNCQNCFDAWEVENLKYCYRALNGFKDSMDSGFGLKSEMLYEYITGAANDYNVKFSCAALNSVRNADYTDYCTDCNNIFGCIGLKKKENAILNKIYPKEEFEKLRAEIIKQMNEMPYIDKASRIYKYGEFFPIELSPWAYNETMAQEIFSLTKEEAKKNGYTWREDEKRNFEITMHPEKIPDSIDEVNEEILKEVLGCAHKGECAHQCITAFRITDYELKFYKKHNIPLPVLCPNCRYGERSAQLPALRLWKRSCMKEGCQNEFETPYAPERPETVYCERCYQNEVY